MRNALLTISLLATAASPALAQNNMSAPMSPPAKHAEKKETDAQLTAERKDVRGHKIADDQKADQERAKARADKIQEDKKDDQRKADERTARIAKTRDEEAQRDASIRADAAKSHAKGKHEKSDPAVSNTMTPKA